MTKIIFDRTRRALLLFAALLLLPGAASAQTPAPARAEKEVRIYGQKIRYVEAGSGPQTVILLHGMGGNSANWTFNINALAAKYRVVVPDQIGFGQSDKPLINYRIATYVDFLDRLYSELKIERATLVGNSMGGWIAALYTIAHPERVERLVLVDAAGFAPPKDFDAKQLAALNPSTREGIRALSALVFYNKQLYLSDAAIDFSLTQRMGAGDGYTIQSLIESIARREDMLDGRLTSIKQPTLIIWGRQDGLTPLRELGERFKREIAGSELIVFEECGHVPMVEKAAEFNAALLKFLEATVERR
ncbi:MAG TPA: alpha/beta hydrolase [Pyrinomonadaceae bacterium]|jgi:pimeloyl-ACP methyl ester carboxylesterase